MPDLQRPLEAASIEPVKQARVSPSRQVAGGWVARRVFEPWVGLPGSAGFPGLTGGVGTGSRGEPKEASERERGLVGVEGGQKRRIPIKARRRTATPPKSGARELRRGGSSARTSGAEEGGFWTGEGCGGLVAWGGSNQSARLEDEDEEGGGEGGGGERSPCLISRETISLLVPGEEETGLPSRRKERSLVLESPEREPPVPVGRPLG